MVFARWLMAAGRLAAGSRWAVIAAAGVVYRSVGIAGAGVRATTVVLEGGHVVLGVVDGRSFIFLYSEIVDETI